MRLKPRISMSCYCMFTRALPTQNNEERRLTLLKDFAPTVSAHKGQQSSVPGLEAANYYEGIVSVFLEVLIAAVTCHRFEQAPTPKIVRRNGQSEDFLFSRSGQRLEWEPYTDTENRVQDQKPGNDSPTKVLLWSIDFTGGRT